MSQRKIVLLLALAVAVAAPATASAAPTVTVTGDDGNPAPLSAAALRPPQHGRDGHRRRPGHRRRQLHRPGLRPRQRGRHAAQHVPGSGVHDVDPALRRLPRQRHLHRRPALLRRGGHDLHRHRDRAALPVRDQRRQRRHRAAGQAAHARAELVLHQHAPARRHPQPRRVHLRGPLRARRRHRARRRDHRTVERDVRQHRQRPRRLPLREAGPLRDRGAREAQHLLHAVERPQPSSTRSRRSTSSASGSRTRAARATSCAARSASASPAARSRSAIAKRWKKGKFRKLGSAKLNSKGRFTKKFRVSGYGKYRLRYTYRGSSLVAAGRVTERDHASASGSSSGSSALRIRPAPRPGAPARPPAATARSCGGG